MLMMTMLLLIIMTMMMTTTMIIMEAVLVWYSLIGQASVYLTDLSCPSLSARNTRHLRSAE